MFINGGRGLKWTRRDLGVAPPGRARTGVALADLDGDKDLDVIAQRKGRAATDVYFNDGQRRLPESRPPAGAAMHGAVWVLLVIAATFGGSAAARAQSGGAISSGTFRVSASVAVTTIWHTEADGTSTLGVAVFWRGTPGWFTAGDPAAQFGGGTSAGLPDGRPGPETHFIGVGGLRLEVQFDPGTGRVRIQDQNISPQRGNVILVDEVDSGAGPRIVETVRVEPRFPGPLIDIDNVVRRHPALLPFLRCDARFPDQPQHSPIEVALWRQMTDLTCARLRDVR